MTRTEFQTSLREFKTASLARARMLIAELKESAARVDAPLREEFRQTVEQLGFAVPVVAAPSLRVGETWLLLYEAPHDGWAVRLGASYGPSLKNLDNELAVEVRRAHRGLLSSAARACRALGQAAPPSLNIDISFGEYEIEGSSLGLSVAIATLSAVLQRSPIVSVAGSAQVDDEGRLKPVEHLEMKLRALQRSWPEVTRVVVAKGQKLSTDNILPFEIVACENLAEAIPIFGLTLEGLRRALLEDFHDRVGRFRTENRKSHDAREWARLSAVAWEASARLAEDDPARSAEARVWAARFAIHSGDPVAADALLRDVSPDTLQEFSELQVLHAITAASDQIDLESVEDAVKLATQAVAQSDLLSPHDRNELRGQALGTQGRALMHAGRFGDAEKILREAFEHHRRYVKEEAPRSACYLATCLRLAGRLSEALAVVNDAVANAEALTSKWNLAVTTGLYLHLERGRIYAALESWEDATADFRFVRDGQPDDFSYPRLGAVRGLARTLRALGKMDEADAALRACIAISRSVHSPVLRKVAAIAAGEALLAPSSSTQVPRSELEQVWEEGFGEKATPSRIAAVVEAWIY